MRKARWRAQSSAIILKMHNGFVEEKISLFTECFGDDMSVVRELFSITDIHSITQEVDGELASLALLVPISDGDIFCGFYAYGVCVSPKWRGRGLFASTMALCEEYAKNIGASFICLIPADGSLGDKYTKMGYSVRVSLADKKQKGDTLITSLSERFFELMNRDADEDAIFDFGLAKLFDEKYEGSTLAFASFFGER